MPWRVRRTAAAAPVTEPAARTTPTRPRCGTPIATDCTASSPRAAWTLLTYLTEINKAGASFFSEYMANNPIPYHYGAEAKIVDVSGESFILGLMTMTPVNIDEKFRNNYITVDPPALAVRLLDIRLALHDEFVADLSHVREENADIMKVACLSNLEGSMRWSATSR